MLAGAENLTGVWQGLYSYPAGGGSVSFVATLIESGHALSGSIHEPRSYGVGSETVYATLLGSRHGNAISFVKTYAASAGPGYGRVQYEGLLNGDRTEIEGRWNIPGSGFGKFLLIRAAGKTATVEQKKSERV
jgi:hypothetical protein